MGFRHSPEEGGRESGFCRGDGGFAEVNGESVVPVNGHNLDTGLAPDRSCPTGDAPPQGGSRTTGVRLGLFALRFYKAYLSLLFAGNCRFSPSCSQFAYEAVERFGLARGSWLAMKRLLRCQPLSRKFGYDPVPENWEKSSSETPAHDVCHSAAARHEVHT